MSNSSSSSKTLFQQGSPFSQRLVSIEALHILKFTYDKFKNLHHAYYILYEVKIVYAVSISNPENEF